MQQQPSAKKVFTFDNNKAIETAKTQNMCFWIVLLSILAASFLAVGITQAVFLFSSQADQNREIGKVNGNLVSNVTLLNTKDVEILSALVIVNMTNMDKIGLLRIETINNFTEVHNELDVINTLLNISGSSANMFRDAVESNFTRINATLINLLAKDMVLMMNVSDLSNTTTNLQTQITTNNNALNLAVNNRISKINGVNGSFPLGHFTLNPVAGLNITTGLMPHSLDLKNTGVLTIQGQTPFPSTGNIQFTGQCGLNVTAGPSSSGITLDTCALATTINNLDMQVYMQQIQIANLTATTVNLQLQINALKTAGDLLVLALNGTSMDLNMTLIQLITQVMILQQEVDTLEQILSNSNNSYVPTGTIVPYGGLTAPLGYLLCNGAVVQQSVYPDLFTVIGESFCPAMMCAPGFFALPDLRGRVPAGVNGGTFTSRGTVVGTETNTLSSSQIPSHSHTIPMQGNHQHSVVLGFGEEYSPGVTGTRVACHSGLFNGPLFVVVGPASSNLHEKFNRDTSITCGATGGPYTRYTKMTGGALYPLGNGATEDGAHDHGGSTGAFGSGLPVLNIQPTLTVGTYIIKT